MVFPGGVIQTVGFCIQLCTGYDTISYYSSRVTRDGKGGGQSSAGCLRYGDHDAPGWLVQPDPCPKFGLRLEHPNSTSASTLHHKYRQLQSL
jgi:hypothetical protein